MKLLAAILGPDSAARQASVELPSGHSVAAKPEVQPPSVLPPTDNTSHAAAAPAAHSCAVLRPGVQAAYQARSSPWQRPANYRVDQSERPANRTTARIGH